MLRDLLNAWRGRDLLSRMLSDFQNMLIKTEWMFSAVTEVLQRKRVAEELQADLYRTDKEVNQSERAIRGEIVSNLILHPDADVAASLILMSVVKDAERVGDYCKNIFEVAQHYDLASDSDPHAAALEATRLRIQKLFSVTRDAFVTSDEAQAQAIAAEAEEIAHWCDDRIAELFHEDLPASKAVVYALLARYFKRIASHLKNIASAVLGTVEDLDYPLGPTHGRTKRI